MNDWQVFIEYKPNQLRTFVYLVRRVDSGTRQFLTKGGTEVITLKDSAPADTDIYFIAVEDDHVLSLVVEAIDKRGIKAPSQSFIQGKYEATNDHLQDLRKLIPRLAPTSEDK